MALMMSRKKATAVSGLAPDHYYSGSPAISGEITRGQTINWTIQSMQGVTFVARVNGKYSSVAHASNYNGGVDTLIKMDGTCVIGSGNPIDLTDVDYYICAQDRGAEALNLAFVFN